MDVLRYLKRISFEKQNEATVDYLTKLQKHHMEIIPFENLDVTRKVEIKLDLDRFYEKIIRNKRGGFCYELNGLFQNLLTELGIQSHLISCTVKKTNGWAKPNTHAAIIVNLDKPYLVDVGFGDSARQPIPLSGEERKDVSGTYRVMKNDDGSFDLQRFEEDWRILYRFSESVKQLEDFTEGCLYNQISPDSTFTHGDIVTIATEVGRISLSGLTVTVTKNGEKEKWELKADEKDNFIQKNFRIIL